jgi:hypothetical protein
VHLVRFCRNGAPHRTQEIVHVLVVALQRAVAELHSHPKPAILVLQLRPLRVQLTADLPDLRLQPVPRPRQLFQQIFPRLSHRLLPQP